MREAISVVIPAWREEARIARAVRAARAFAPEVIVVDGGSPDRTAARARAAGARVVVAEKGRGAQLRAGAAAASGDVLVFLHADCRAPAEAGAAVGGALADPRVGGGTFGVRFVAEGGEGVRAAEAFTRVYALQRRFLGIAYGDCGLFVRRAVYEAVGGHAPLPLMEDLDLLRRLRRTTVLRRLESVVVEASGRRFVERPLRSAAVYAGIQTLYLLGASPHLLARLYADVRRPADEDARGRATRNDRRTRAPRVRAEEHAT